MASQWGLYLSDDVTPAIVAESVVTFEMRQDYVVANYPLESGAFESYDKVWTPFVIRMRLTSQPGAQARATFLADLEAIAENTILYDAVTPDIVYTSVNVVHKEYRRTAENGVSLIVAELWLQQIMENVSPQYTNVASPAAAAPVNGGTAQTQPATTANAAAVKAAPDLTNPATVGFPNYSPGTEGGMVPSG